jgi:hypothetical protein
MSEAEFEFGNGGVGGQTKEIGKAGPGDISFVVSAPVTVLVQSLKDLTSYVKSAPDYDVWASKGFTPTDVPIFSAKAKLGGIGASLNISYKPDNSINVSVTVGAVLTEELDLNRKGGDGWLGNWSFDSKTFASLESAARIGALGAATGGS